MIKYNYKKAGEIWDKLILITYDMPDYLEYTQRQYERRFFLHMLTRNEIKKKNHYIDWISQFASEMEPDDVRKKELGKIALEITLFYN